MRIALEELHAEPEFHGPWKPVECWHHREGPIRGVLTVEEGMATLHCNECELPVSLIEPADMEMHEGIEVTTEWIIEQDYFGEINAHYLLMTPVRERSEECQRMCSPHGGIGLLMWQDVDGDWHHCPHEVTE